MRSYRLALAGATTPRAARPWYGRGLAAVTPVQDLNPATSASAHDGIGPVTAMHRPRLDNPRQPSDIASLIVTYHLPDDTGMPVVVTDWSPSCAV